MHTYYCKDKGTHTLTFDLNWRRRRNVANILSYTKAIVPSRLFQSLRNALISIICKFDRNCSRAFNYRLYRDFTSPSLSREIVRHVYKYLITRSFAFRVSRETTKLCNKNWREMYHYFSSIKICLCQLKHKNRPLKQII